MASRQTRGKVDLLRMRRCASGKVGWVTRDEALDAAELMMLNGHVEAGCHIMPYQCETCRQWHIGNRRIVPVE